MPWLRQSNTNQARTSSYATLLRAKTTSFPKITLTITNSHGTNAIKYKVLVSNTDQPGSSDWAEEKAEATLAAGAADRYALSGSFQWVDVQIVDNSAGNHGTGNAFLNAVGL
jgi:hypothetical protein